MHAIKVQNSVWISNYSIHIAKNISLIGNGVVLTATWLLPVALVPMAWDAGDIYGPRAPPKPEEMTAEAEAENPPTKSEPDGKEKPKEKKKTSLFRW